MYPSDDSHDLYIREKQLMLAGTAMWLAKQAADKANGREVQDDLLHHVMSCHYADLLLQQFIVGFVINGRNLLPIKLDETPASDVPF